MTRKHSAQKVEVDYKSYLIDLLAEIHDRKCPKCGTTKNLIIDYIVGQEYLEDEYYEPEYDDVSGERWDYYIEYFADESEYLGLICTKCKQYNKPDYPTLSDIITTLSDFLDEKQEREIEEYLEKYPQAKPFHMRLLRVRYRELGLL